MAKDKNDKEYLEKVLFNEKSLMLLNVKDLREIGRKLGLPSSTTLKKNELVSSILEIVYGNVQIKSRNLAGRPSVHKFNLEKYISKIKANEIPSDTVSIYRLDQTDFGTFKISSPSEEEESLDNIEIRFYSFDGEKSYLKKRGFVDSKDDIEISNDLAKSLNLENFDVIEINIIDDKFKIISINGEMVGGKISDIEICGEKVKRGQIRDFYLRTKEEIKKEIQNIINYCNSSKLKAIILSQNDFEESENIKCVKYDASEKPQNFYKKLVYFAGLCEKYIFESEDVVVIYENFDDVENFAQNYEEKVKNRLNNYLNDTTKRLLELGNLIVKFNISTEKYF